MSNEISTHFRLIFLQTHFTPNIICHTIIYQKHLLMPHTTVLLGCAWYQNLMSLVVCEVIISIVYKSLPANQCNGKKQKKKCFMSHSQTKNISFPILKQKMFHVPLLLHTPLKIIQKQFISTCSQSTNPLILLQNQPNSHHQRNHITNVNHHWLK